MPTPQVILYSSDAQGQANPLSEVSMEMANIYKMFLPIQDQGLINIRNYPNSTFSSLLDDLRNLRSRVLVWHFAGHANQSGIDLADKQILLGPLSGLIGAYWRPKLIFLNGCSTQGMVKELLNKGVGAVIATNSQIADENARSFAENFYHVWLGGDSLKGAFDFASKVLLASPGLSGGNLRHGIRHLNISDENDEDLDGLAWGLYVDKSNPRAEYIRFRKSIGRGFARRFFPLILAFMVLLALSFWAKEFYQRSSIDNVGNNTEENGSDSQDTINNPGVKPDDSISEGYDKPDGGEEETGLYPPLPPSPKHKPLAINITDQFGNSPEADYCNNYGLSIVKNGHRRSYPLGSWSSRIKDLDSLPDEGSLIFVQKNGVAVSDSMIYNDRSTEILTLRVWPIFGSMIFRDFSPDLVSPSVVVGIEIEGDPCTSFKLRVKNTSYRIYELLPVECIFFSPSEDQLEVSVIVENGDGSYEASQFQLIKDGSAKKPDDFEWQGNLYP